MTLGSIVPCVYCVFLIIYFFMLAVVGMPMLYMELALGQFCSKPCTQAFNCCPLLKGTGYSLVLLCLYITAVYTIIITYAFDYFISSFKSPLPWFKCNNPLFKNCSQLVNQSSIFTDSDRGNIPCSLGEDCVETIDAAEVYWAKYVLNISSGIDETGDLQVHLFWKEIVVMIFIMICTLRGIHNMGKLAYISSVLPYVILSVLLFESLQLDGALDGIYFFFEPKWNAFYTPSVWRDAGTQIFYSLAITTGGLITLSSYNRFHNNIYKDCWTVIIVNTGTSLYAGITIFATLGYIAKLQDIDISQVAVSGPSLAFVVYAHAIALKTSPRIFSFLFFLMLIFLGLDTMFANMETLVTAVAYNFGETTKHKKEIISICACTIIFLMQVTLVTQSGYYWLEVYTLYGGSLPVIFTAAIEVLIISQFYGVEQFAEDIELMQGEKPRPVYLKMWKYFTPYVLVVVSIASVVGHEPLSTGMSSYYSEWADAIGTTAVISIIAMIPGRAAYEIYHQTGTILERVKKLLKPNKEWRPLRDEDCIGKYRSHRHSKWKKTFENEDFALATADSSETSISTTEDPSRIQAHDHNSHSNRRRASKGSQL